MRAIPAIGSGLLLLTLVVPMAHAQLATGRWTPAYGTPLVVQSTQSTGKYGAGGRAASTSYELDAAYGYVDGGALHLLLTGNIVMGWNVEGQTIWSPIDVFLDTRAGGQTQLLPNNPVASPADYDLTTMTGMRFDPGFEPDWWFCAGADPLYCCGTYVVKAVMAELPTAGGGAGTLLGDVPLGASAPLSGGSNPGGVSVAIDDSNTAGVTHGCGAWSGPEIGSGIEFVIPLAAIGSPTGCIRVCAFDPVFNGNTPISNQVLGPLPPGTCDLGPAGSVDFGAIPGPQWFTICPSGITTARRATWGSLKAIYR